MAPQLLRRQRLRPAQAASILVQTIRGQDHAEVTAFAKTWPKGAAAYPHLAAGATLQRYVGPEGIPAAKLFPSPRRQRRPSPRQRHQAEGSATQARARRKAGRRSRR
jgi:hypothetical protein